MSFIEWKDLFDDIFEGYPDQWTLTHVHRNDKIQFQKLQNQRKMEREGYARFHCPKCSNGWASAKAKVVFYYPNFNQPLGRVSMRFYGQQCRKCSRVNNNFVDPEYDDDKMKLILEKLYEIIGYNCYGKQRPPKPKNYVEKENNIQGPHEKNLCEACKMGCCDQISI